jgi:hypothetical protein
VKIKIKRNTGAIQRQHHAICTAPDFPERVRAAHEQFREAVSQAAVSGVIEATYDRLPAAVKAEFSFKTFERNVEAQ